MIEQLMTPEEAASHLRASVDTVYRLCRSGKLSHHRLGPKGGTIRVHPSDLEAYVASCRVEAGTRTHRTGRFRPR